MKKNELIKLLDDVLNIKFYEKYDVSLNGVQVDNNKDEINKICFAVDACYESIKRAVDMNADMLFVHHGLFWGECFRLSGIHYMRFRELIKNDVLLYAAHLPLDANAEYGNNFTMAKILGLANTRPWCEYRGVNIGVCGECKEGYDIETIIKKLGFTEKDDLKLLPFGKIKNIKRIGIVSGGAADEEDLEQAINTGVDLYITGEHSHVLYHKAREEKISVLSGGHYHTEIFGVKSMASFLTSLGLECKFIDIPTGM